MIADIKNRCVTLCNSILCFFNRANMFAAAHEKGIFWAGAILYKFALDAMYIWAASPQYARGGLVYAPSFVRYIIATVMYLIMFAVLPKNEHDTVAFLLHLQFVFTVAPLLSFYALSGGSSRYMLMVFICILLQTWLVQRGDGSRKRVSISGIQSYVTVALGVLAIFTFLIPILYNGFEGLKSFDLKYIYTMRANATYPPGFEYLLNWMTKCILPFALLCFLQRKKYLFALATIVLEVCFYMETGYKIFLFIFVPILFIYVLSKSGHLLKLLYIGFFILCIGIVVGYQLDKAANGISLGVLLNSLVGVRAIFVPANIKFDYYGCFSQYPKLFFSDGLIGKMLSSSYLYKGSAGQVVNAFAGFDFGSANANTGYLGDAYAQMGFLGMLLMSSLLALILRGLRAYESRQNFAVLTALFSVFFIILNDGALFTTLFTGGMLLAFLLIFIYYGKAQEELNDGI